MDILNISAAAQKFHFGTILLPSVFFFSVYCSAYGVMPYLVMWSYQEESHMQERVCHMDSIPKEMPQECGKVIPDHKIKFIQDRNCISKRQWISRWLHTSHELWQELQDKTKTEGSKKNIFICSGNLRLQLPSHLFLSLSLRKWCIQHEDPLIRLMECGKKAVFNLSGLVLPTCLLTHP